MRLSQATGTQYAFQKGIVVPNSDQRADQRKDFSTEEWRPIPETEGRYEVNCRGSVRFARTGRLRKGTVQKNGYVLHVFDVDKKSKGLLEHRMVATAFIGPCPEGCQCNHINGIKTDNRVENLEWVTAKENSLHRNSLLRTGSCKLHHEDIPTIQNMLDFGDTYGVIATRFGVGTATIRAIAVGKTWRHVNPDWEPISRGTRRGSDSPNSILNEAQVREIQALLDQDVPERIIAEKYGTDRSNISNIGQGESWKHVNPGWRKKNPGKARGERVVMAKLTEEDVRRIRNLIKAGVKQVDIAEMFNVSKATITRVKQGACWAHVS